MRHHRGKRRGSREAAPALAGDNYSRCDSGEGNILLLLSANEIIFNRAVDSISWMEHLRLGCWLQGRVLFLRRTWRQNPGALCCGRPRRLAGAWASLMAWKASYLPTINYNFFDSYCVLN